MNIKVKLFANAILLSLCFSQAYARRPLRHHNCRPAPIVSVQAPIHHYIAVSRTNNRFNQRERMAMALAFLKSHPYLTVKDYEKMTSLRKEAAEAELEAFVMNRNIPIRSYLKGKKKYYVIQKKIHD